MDTVINNDDAEQYASNVPPEKKQLSLVERLIMRFISPRFYDEVNQWFSSIPVLSAIIQILLGTLGYFLGVLKMFSIVSESSSAQKGGIGALVIVLLQLALSIALLLALASGFITSIMIVGTAVQAMPWAMNLFLIICLIGALFKNSTKVKLLGSNADKFSFSMLYRVGIVAATGLTTFGVMTLFSGGHENTLKSSGLADMDAIFIPIVGLAAMVVIFHGFIKPLITNIIIIYIRLLAKPTQEESVLLTENTKQTNQSMGKARAAFSVLRYLLIIPIIALFAALPFSDFITLVQSILIPERAPLPAAFAIDIIYPLLIAFWAALITWFALASILSPQKSIIAKLMRLFKKSSNSASSFIVCIGIITLVGVLYTINADLQIISGDKATREAESVIYKKVTASDDLSRMFYLDKKKGQVTNPYIREIAANIYLQYKNSGTLSTLRIEEYNTQYNRRVYKSEKNYYTFKIANQTIASSARHLFKALISIMIVGVIIIMLGIFTKDIKHFVMYLVSIAIIPLLVGHIITASSDKYIDDVKEGTEKIINKLHYTVVTGDFNGRKVDPAWINAHSFFQN